MTARSPEFWIFAYGSLMWDPGFLPEESVKARLFGWHRAMCIMSVRYRGRPDAPGLVLGLDRGGCCAGLVLRPGRQEAESVRTRLIEREMITGVYTPRTSKVKLIDGRVVAALIFTARPDHQQYQGKLSLADQVELVRRGQGDSGSARDYLAKTISCLDSHAIADKYLKNLLYWVDHPA